MPRPFTHHTARHYAPRMVSALPKATVMVNGQPVPAWQAKQMREQENRA